MLKIQMNRTAAIVRTYGYPDIGKFVQKLLNFGIRHVIVVVPKDQDNGVTAPILKALGHPRVYCLEQPFAHGGRGWSAMLNVGLDFYQQALGDEFIDYVLMVSNTITLDVEHLSLLYRDLGFPNVMVAGLPFCGIGKGGETMPLGVAYNHHYRNTLALYKREAFLAHQLLWRFDETFDGAGGMEDLAWKLILQAMTEYRAVENLELPEHMRVPLAVHTHRTPEQQDKYEADMEAGIQTVEDHVAKLLAKQAS